MVHDRLEHIGMYLPMEYRSRIKDFLVQLSVDMPEGRLELDGDAVYARIMSYPTKLATDCMIEAHDVYVDIQFTLIGGEGIGIFPRAELRETAADKGKDFHTFAPGMQPCLSVANLPGWFTMLFPHEAHRPQESLDGKCSVVKKGVIKIKMDCFRQGKGAEI